MKRVVLLLLLVPAVAMAAASQPYVNTVPTSGTLPAPLRTANPTNPAAWPVTPFNMGGVARYRVSVCASAGFITAAMVRLWLWIPATGLWSQNETQNITFSPLGVSGCTSVGVTADLSNGYLYPQVINATSDTAGSTFTVRVDS